MADTYMPEFPYSEELYHHGIPNQRWGDRRYQNPDGSLTPLGREHYGVGPPRPRRNGIGRRFVNYQLDRIRARHPWMFSDEGLEEATTRAKNVYNYKKVRDDIKSFKHMSRGRRVIGDILESGVKSLATKGFNKLGDNLFDKKKIKDGDYESMLNNPTAYTKEELDTARLIYEGRQKVKAVSRQQDSISSKLYNQFNASYDVTRPYGGYTEEEYTSMLNAIESARFAEGLAKRPKNDGSNSSDPKKGSSGGNPDKKNRSRNEHSVPSDSDDELPDSSSSPARHERPSSHNAYDGHRSSLPSSSDYDYGRHKQDDNDSFGIKSLSATDGSQRSHPYNDAFQVSTARISPITGSSPVIRRNYNSSDEDSIFRFVKGVGAVPIVGGVDSDFLYEHYDDLTNDGREYLRQLGIV